jgi:hypothetical protein
MRTSVVVDPAKYFYNPKELSILVTYQGRLTIAEILYPNGCAFAGVSKCNPEDEYNRELGTKIAIGRASIAGKKAYLEGLHAGME